MMKVSIERTRRDDYLLQYIEDWLKSMSLDEETGQVSWPHSFTAEITQEVLASKIRGSGLSDWESTTRYLSGKVVISLKKQRIEKPKWKAIEQVLQEEAEKYASMPLAKYKLLFLLHADLSKAEPRERLDALGVAFEILSWRQVYEQVQYPQFAQIARFMPGSDSWRLEQPPFGLFTPLLVNTQARTYEQAFRPAEAGFDFWRALLNLTYAYGRSFWSSDPRPIGEVLPAPISGVFRGDGEYLIHYYNIERLEYRQAQDITEDKLKAVEGIGAQIADVTDERMKQLLIDILLSYGRAMDTVQSQHAFLHLWQILERISLWSAEESQKSIISRVVALTGLDKPLFNDLLHSLRSSRNDFVHRGQFAGDGQSDVDFLKFFAERAIGSLLDRLDILPTYQSLRQFYQLAFCGDNELKTRRDVVDAILKMRGNEGSK